LGGRKRGNLKNKEERGREEERKRGREEEKKRG